MVLLSSSCRETAQKGDKQNIRGETTGFLLPKFFVESFWHIFWTPLAEKRTKTL
jgi:hypothetical protein